jgi:hypothetical protein
MTMYSLQRGSPPPEDHHLRPLMTYSSPCFWMLHWMFGLGHEKRRAHFAAQERLEPAALLLLAAVALDGFHVAGVGRRAVEHFRGKRHPAHDLAQRRVLEVGQSFRGALGMRQEQVPQPGGARLGLEFLDDLGRYPRVALAPVFQDLLVESMLVRVDVLIHERDESGLHGLYLFGICEIHFLPFLE